MAHRVDVHRVRTRCASGFAGPCKMWVPTLYVIWGMHGPAMLLARVSRAIRVSRARGTLRVTRFRVVRRMPPCASGHGRACARVAHVVPLASSRYTVYHGRDRATLRRATRTPYARRVSCGRDRATLGRATRVWCTRMGGEHRRAQAHDHAPRRRRRLPSAATLAAMALRSDCQSASEGASHTAVKPAASASACTSRAMCGWLRRSPSRLALRLT